MAGTFSDVFADNTSPKEADPSAQADDGSQDAATAKGGEGFVDPPKPGHDDSADAQDSGLGGSGDDFGG